MQKTKKDHVVDQGTEHALSEALARIRELETENKNLRQEKLTLRMEKISLLVIFIAIINTLLSKINVLRILNAGHRMAKNHLRKHAYEDALTGLFNRHYAEVESERLIEIYKRSEMETFICTTVIDIDKFKDINDCFGHATGDTVLRSFGPFVQKWSRKSDICARWGGDEFVIILFANSENEAFNAGLELCKRFASVPCPIINTNITISASVGWSVCHIDDFVLESEVKKADFMMYKHKRQHNCACA